MLNFIKVIGQRMENSGLSNIIVESAVYTSSMFDSILKGKLWNRAIRCHKIVYEALWRILLADFKNWLQDTCNKETKQFDSLLSTIKQLIDQIREKKINYVAIHKDALLQLKSMESFEEYLTDTNTTMEFWLSYLNMVDTLLTFIYSERMGDWQGYLTSFSKMLPWFAIYDHINYARWGTIYYLDMQALETTAPLVYEEYSIGNFFSVKSTHINSFNSISVDQALEHINRTSKVAGGIIGITRNDIRRDEWCLSFNNIGSRVENFNSIIGNDDIEITKNVELGEKRLQKDEADVKILVELFVRFKVFNRNCGNLVNITTNDVIPSDVQQDILQAEFNGGKIIQQIVTSITSSDFYKPLKRNNIKSFSHLETTKFQSKVLNNSLKKGQQIIQRLLSVSKQRNIETKHIYSYELTDYPMSLAINESLCLSIPNNKSSLRKILQGYGQLLNSNLEIQKESKCLVIDGMSIVQSIGKPKSIQTFGQYADIFCKIIISNFDVYAMVDLVFDHYEKNSIKNCTRSKRKSVNSSIRKIIDYDDVPLPVQWANFIHSWENKRDLTNYLSNYILNVAKTKNLNFVTSGGFHDECAFKSVFSLKYIEELQASHEEADTRILLHIMSAKKNGLKNCVVQCRDTDVLVLLLYFRDELTESLLMKTSKDNFINIKYITIKPEMKTALLTFDALTGSDTTSQFVGIGKKKAWKVFEDECDLLNIESMEELTEKDFKKLEQFIIHLYVRNSKCQNINELRAMLATKLALDKLPPTRDALKQHCLRALYLILIWKNALVPKPKLPPFLNYGWCNVNDDIKPIFMTQSAIPSLKAEISFCSCKTDCATTRCTCKTNTFSCVSSCYCMANCNCKNEYTKLTEELDEEDD